MFSVNKRMRRQNTEDYNMEKMVLYLRIVGKFLLLVERLTDENRSASIKSAPLPLCITWNALGFN